MRSVTPGEIGIVDHGHICNYIAGYTSRMLLAPLLFFFFFAALQPYDVVVRNGHIVDGTGSPWYAADIGIRGGKIAAIGHLEGAPARRSIDAHGMVVAPGFIDMLGQSELTILVDPRLPSKIFQGITTEITGEGGSIAPLNDAIIKADHVTYEHYGIKPTWRTLGAAALIAALVIGFINATVGVVLKILTFPLTLVTLGLFWLVINALMLELASALLAPGFQVRGFFAAFVGAIVLSLVNMLLKWLVRPPGASRD